MHIYLQERDPAASIPAGTTPERGGHRAGGLLSAAPKHRVSPLSLATSSPFPT